MTRDQERWKSDFWEFCAHHDSPLSFGTYGYYCAACRSRECLPECRHQFRHRAPEFRSPLLVSPSWPGVVIDKPKGQEVLRLEGE